MYRKNDLFFRFFELIFIRMKKVALPISKSLYIRKLIYDFLYNDCIGAIPLDSSEDIRVVHQSLTCISQTAGCGIEQPKPQRIDVQDCGAAYRFLMAVLAVTPGQWLLTGTERLLQRPIEELVQALRSIGAEIQWCSGRDVPWRVSNGGGVDPCIDVQPCVFPDKSESSGRDAMHCVSTNENCGCWQIHGKPLHASELTIDCTRSGQFASALWLISKKIGLKNLKILPQNPSSSAYIAMTKSIVNGEADLNAKRMGDWSAAVYWYARLLLEGRMCGVQRSHFSSGATSCDASASYKLLYLDLQSFQSDAIIAQWFSQWGVVSRQEEDGVVIEYDEDVDIRIDEPEINEADDFQNKGVNFDKSHEFQGDEIELDLRQNLDLVPVLACMACLWPKKMVFNGVANLKYKESDRLKIIQKELSEFSEIKLNVYDGINDNQLVVNPICCRDGARPVSTNEKCSNDTPIIFSFDAHNDHRFVMGFSLFALYGKVQIKGYDCVRKSYPNFNAEGVVGGTDMVG